MEPERQSGRDVSARMTRRARVALLSANAAGALVTFSLGTWVVPAPADGVSERNIRINVVAFGFVLLVGLLGGTYLSARAARTSQDWLSHERLPTDAQRDATLSMPVRLTAIQAVLWMTAAVGFLLINVWESTTLALEAAVEVLLGGTVTCALSYLMLERIVRPGTQRALEHSAPDRPTGPAIGGKLLLIWAAGSAMPLVAVGLVGVAVLSGVSASRHQIGLAVALVALVGVLAGFATMAIYARSLSEPLRALRAALGRVERGDFEASVAVDDAGEIGVLEAGFNRMAIGLRERERLRDLFGRHVGEEVAQQAFEREGIELGGETLEAAILFVDVIGSTTLAATRDPVEVVARLNEFFAIVVDCVSLHGGWVNKFEGDAALCVFGAPTSHPDPAGSALASARALMFRLDGELDGIEAAIGVSAGAVVAGNVGAAERFEYTVIGDPVNEAARLTELAKGAEPRLLASEAALARAGARERDRWRFEREESLRGRIRPTGIVAPR